MKKFIPLLLMVLLFACKEEDTPTQGEITAQQVRDVMEQWRVNTVDVYQWYNTGYVRMYGGSDFKIEGTFLNVGATSYYNFASLSHFDLGSRSMALYFK